MNNEMQAGMLEATRLTRAGRLMDATALIQRTLQGRPAPERADEIIEGEFEVVEPAPAAVMELPPPAGAASEPQPAANSAHSAKPQPARPCRATTRGQFRSAAYTNAAGTRPYKLYIPSGYAGQAMPLVVMLHGCTQNADDFATGTRMNALAEERQFLAAYPIQVAAGNQSKCWNWFKAADQRRGAGEPSIIAGITEEIMRLYNVDRRRIYLVGLSAGGAMAMNVAMAYPEIYAAVGIHSGLAYRAADDLRSALAAMQHGANIQTDRAPAGDAARRGVPAIVFHGDQDTTVHPRNGEQVIAQWAALYGEAKLRSITESGRAPGGHAYTCAIYRDANGASILESWLVHGAGHGWSGGSAAGSFTVPAGPDATKEMIRFFLEHPQKA